MSGFFHQARRSIALRAVALVGFGVPLSCHEAPNSVESAEVLWNRTLPAGSGVQLGVAAVLHRSHTPADPGGWSCGYREGGCRHLPARSPTDQWDARLVFVPGPQDHPLTVGDQERWENLAWTAYGSSGSAALRELDALRPRFCPNAEGNAMVVIFRGEGTVHGIDHRNTGGDDLADVELGPCDAPVPGGRLGVDALCACVAAHTGLLGPRRGQDGGADGERSDD